MKILWITNTIFPAPSKALSFPKPVTGGWMYGLAEQLSASPGIRLAVATTYLGKEIKTFDIGGVLYYLLPAKPNAAYQKHLESIWQNIGEEFKPDLVHVHGTERAHSLACMRSCPELNYIVSIQGLVSVISKYYYSGITPREILENITFRDIVRWDSMFQQKKSLKKRGELENLQRTKHVIGRTSWDYAHVKSINPTVNYHFCNESLRDNFYTAEKWDISHKTDYTIFCSQAGCPIKGLHQVLKAVALLKKDFPNIQVRVAGCSIINRNTLIEKIKLSGYGAYLRSLIKKGNLWENVHFTGTLTARQMVAEYKNAHVFICSSSIENSPNSLGEAQLLGIPTIAAYAGGIPDMVVHGETGLLYRFEEAEMLAESIRRVFTDDSLANHLSLNGISAAEHRHDRSINLDRILNIYREIGRI